MDILALLIFIVLIVILWPFIKAYALLILIVALAYFLFTRSGGRRL